MFLKLFFLYFNYLYKKKISNNKMSKQIYVDCNRINCDDKNNDETNIWTYKLRNELDLQELK